MSPKESNHFKSIQILSSKAHELWSKAKSAKMGSKSQSSLQELIAEDKDAVKLIVELKLSSVIKATLAIFAIYFGALLLFAIRDKLFIMALAFFLSIVIDASVNFLERIKIPRSIAVVLVYLTFISVLLFIVASLVPIVARQVQDLARLINRSADNFIANPQINLPFVSQVTNMQFSASLHDVLSALEIKDRASALLQFGQNLSLAAQTSVAFAVGLAGSVVNFLINLILILFLTFFMQMEKEKIADYFLIFFPKKYRHYIQAKSEEIYHKMSQWTQGQLILCLSIGLLSFVALTILGMPYALTLALLAGITEFIPYIGPLVAAVPAVLVGLSQGNLLLAFIVAAIYYAIQITENHILVPLIMKHSVGLSPILVMFSMLVAVSFPATIHPIVGIIIAVPVMTIIKIFVGDLREITKKK